MPGSGASHQESSVNRGRYQHGTWRAFSLSAVQSGFSQAQIHQLERQIYGHFQGVCLLLTATQKPESWQHDYLAKLFKYKIKAFHPVIKKHIQLL